MGTVMVNRYRPMRVSSTTDRMLCIRKLLFAFLGFMPSPRGAVNSQNRINVV